METSSDHARLEAGPLASELEELGQKLQDRASIRRLARAYLMALVGFIAFGVGSRLLLESTRFPYLAVPVLALFLFCLVFGTRDALAGRRLLAEERRDFRRYRELRAEAGLE